MACRAVVVTHGAQRRRPPRPQRPGDLRAPAPQRPLARRPFAPFAGPLRDAAGRGESLTRGAGAREAAHDAGRSQKLRKNEKGLRRSETLLALHLCTLTSGRSVYAASAI